MSIKYNKAKHVEFGDVRIQHPGRNTHAKELLIENVYFVKEKYYNNTVAKVNRKLASLEELIEMDDVKDCLESYCVNIWFERGLDKVLYK